MLSLSILRWKKIDRSLSARNKDIVIALVDDGFTAKQLILGEHIILRAHNENYADIVVKGSLELFGNLLLTYL